MASTVNGIVQERRLVTPIPGPQSQAMMARRKAAVSNGVGAAHQVFIDRGAGGVLVDVDGNSIIDLGSGIAVTSVGNAAPLVVEGLSAQAQKLTHTCFMIAGYDAYLSVCEKLNELTPGDHEKRTALFNSGAESVENAIKIARHYTGRSDVVAFEHGYHGRTNLTMGLTAKNMPFKDRFGPFTPGIHRVPVSYPLRDQSTAEQALDRVIRKIHAEVGASNVAAIIIEPILGEGGFIVPESGFLQGLVEFAREHGIVFIADEVQTGFARTGDWFACDHEGIVPDLLTTAKGIAGGLPLAGVTGRAEIMDSVHVGGLGGTYGGNPVACAAALGSIQTMIDEDLVSRAREIGEILNKRLTELASSTSVVAQVRGRGAMIAVELVDPATGEPAADLTKRVSAACMTKGVLVLTAGTYGNVLRFLPPLVIDLDLLNEGLDVVAEVIGGEVGA